MTIKRTEASSLWSPDCLFVVDKIPITWGELLLRYELKLRIADSEKKLKQGKVFESYEKYQKSGGCFTEAEYRTVIAVTEGEIDLPDYKINKAKKARMTSIMRCNGLEVNRDQVVIYDILANIKLPAGKIEEHKIFPCCIYLSDEKLVSEIYFATTGVKFAFSRPVPVSLLNNLNRIHSCL